MGARAEKEITKIKIMPDYEFLKVDKVWKRSMTVIIEMLPTLKPYEKIEIMVDQNGRPGFIIIGRQSKIVVSDQDTKNVKFKSND